MEKSKKVILGIVLGLFVVGGSAFAYKHFYGSCCGFCDLKNKPVTQK